MRMRIRKRIARKKDKKYNGTVIFLLSIIFLSTLILIIKHSGNNRVYAGQDVVAINYDFNIIPTEETEEPSNLQQSEIIETEIELEYITIYETDETLPKGMIQIKQEGRTGIQQIITKKTYENGEVISEEKISDKIIKAAINKIVVTGTANYKNDYKVKVGDTLYVTPNTLSVRKEKDVNADKITTLEKNMAVVLIEKGSKWHKISYKNYEGYVLVDSLTHINPNGNFTEEDITDIQEISKLSFDMNVSKPSGLSIEQFKKIFSNQERDVNKIFENNAQYFYYAEKQYNINGIFLAAIAIHESNWGTSTIAKNKKNLFGYGAVDSNPYGGAYNFSNYSESIDLVARALVKYYLNPSGTKIYNGESASGDYYNGPTISGVNTRYATDSNWKNCVYKYMKLLYENL